MRKKLIEGDTVWERTRKRKKSAEYQRQKLIHKSLSVHFFSEILSIVEEREVLIFHVAKVQILVLLSKRNRNIAQQ